ncbi:hypothetical protein GXW83_10820 [Streptacidiphilus sp. PB12-B1b]|uniref:hypothetical protein n=1 Tax=Streptacidiphilus sp. PB12-B1b TaxID=2705012 RepID=UPI0015FE68FD|nr:hypothetical protein [Streptacidiphilus sp. PB12-B1b]QMU76157.1 hypothetical protein GXW83_10820 [Streptacidiphilus sp. PB12-B1b]
MLTRHLTGGRLGAATAAAASALLFGVLSAPGAAADGASGGGGGGSCNPTTGVCGVGASTPASPGGGSSGGGSGGSGGGGTCSYQGTTVPCELPGYGYWDGEGCYDELENPQPPANAVIWYGHNPADGGAIYWQYCPYGGGPAGIVYFQAYLPTPPPGQPDQESPGQIAAEMMKNLKLYGVAIDSAPASGGTGLVGLPVWLWTRSNLQLPAVTATVGDVSVTMKAAIGHITWSLGDGSASFTCAHVNTAYQASDGATTAPACGRSAGYRAAGDYTVTATSVWGVTWTSNIGIDNPVPAIVDEPSRIRLTIDQAQALNTAPEE